MTRALLAALAVLSLLGAIQTYRVSRVKSELVAVKIERDAAVKLADAIQTVSREDAQLQADQCLARVNKARRSARRIETIIDREIPNDANGCPLRPLIGADELREALQPAGPTPPQPLQRRASGAPPAG